MPPILILKTIASNRKHAGTLYAQKRQIARCIGAGIDIHAVGADIGFANRGMAMNDELAEIVLTVEEFVANPQQV